MDPTNVVRALRCLGWGGLLLAVNVSVSFKTNGEGFRFDLFNNFAGMLLIGRGAWLLGSCPSFQARPVQRKFLIAALGVSTLKALGDHVVLADAPLAFLGSAWEPVDAAAGLVLLNLVRLASADAGLAATERASARALRATCFLQALPTAAWGALHLIERIRPSHLAFPPAIGVAILVAQFVLPLAFFLLLRRAKRDTPASAEPVTASPRVVGAAVLALLAIAPPTLAAELYWQLRIKNRDAICGSHSGSSWDAADGRVVNVDAGRNGRGELRIVVIRELSRRTARLKNDVELRYRYPADEAASGLWIDGERRDLTEAVALVHVSDVLPARVFEVSPEEGRRWAALGREDSDDALRSLRER